jgi:uncharacterized SAM-binding protein YcdF (DUF218 family)
VSFASGLEQVDAIVVLGCAARGGRASPALRRRIALAVRAHREGVAPTIVAAGGRAWDGHLEAHVVRDALAELVPDAHVLLEDRSQNTAENARYSAFLLRERALERVMVATCRWHLPRALANFRRCGVVAVAPPVAWLEGPEVTLARWLRERASDWLDARLLAKTQKLE